jgi:hypothetical protein
VENLATLAIFPARFRSQVAGVIIIIAARQFSTLLGFPERFFISVSFS